ncbi:hypothetical protein [Streptomyces sp. NPDC003401]
MGDRPERAGRVRGIRARGPDAVVRSAALAAVGPWRWPAGLGGAVLRLVSRRTLRRAADGLCHPAEAVVAPRRAAPPPSA